MVGRDNHLSKKIVPRFLRMDSISTFFNRLRHVYEVFTNHCYLSHLQVIECPNKRTSLLKKSPMDGHT
jgi:hypothetical protein